MHLDPRRAIFWGLPGAVVSVLPVDAIPPSLEQHRCRYDTGDGPLFSHVSSCYIYHLHIASKERRSGPSGAANIALLQTDHWPLLVAIASRWRATVTSSSVVQI